MTFKHQLTQDTELLNLKYHEGDLYTGQLSFSAGAVLSQLRAKPSVINIVPATAADRQAVEQFIIDIYAKAYGAKIGVHYPTLMSVRDEAGSILAAVGFRSAAESPLFLEQYLDRPVQDVLRTPRRQIAEIGSLASNGGGASLFLFVALSAYLCSRGFTKAAITGTSQLQQRFRSLGLQPVRHAQADANLLLSHDEDWGNYYETQPYVISGSLDKSYRQLKKRLGADYQDHRPRLLPRLHYSYKDAV